MAREPKSLETSTLILTESNETALDQIGKAGLALASDCAGEGSCGQCRVRILDGSFNSLTAVERALLDSDEIEAGIRLACQLCGEGQIEFSSLSSEAEPLIQTELKAATSDSCFGIAIDLGTTTLRLSLLDLNRGRRLGALKVLNSQAVYGADVMTRLAWVMENDSGGLRLSDMIRSQLWQQIKSLATECAVALDQIERITIVGNTAMIHLLLQLDVESLALAPYTSSLEGEPHSARPCAEWGWILAPEAVCLILPIVRSFVGSDLLADILACRMYEREGWMLLLDLGTNGEVALGNRNQILCTSAAAGCAFEATSLRCGVGTRPGAIWRVRSKNHRICFDTLEDEAPIGFCGSGAISGIEYLLRSGCIESTGRIVESSRSAVDSSNGVLRLSDEDGTDLYITQDDIRQIQLAKAAISAATRILIDHAKLEIDQLSRAIVIGNFGTHLDVDAAMAIGLLPPVAPKRIEIQQEATLCGAERALISPRVLDQLDQLTEKIEWISLVEQEDFVERFAQAMELKPQ